MRPHKRAVSEKGGFMYNNIHDNFSEKYDMYSSMIFKIAMTYMGNKSDAEDVMQEVFIKLIYNSPEFSNSEHEKRWIICVTSNICRNILKSFRRKNTQSLEEIGNSLSVPFEYDNAEILFSLKPKYRIVLYLMYYENYSVSEIADILSISQSAVKMRLKRGREKLKLDIEEGLNYEKTGLNSHNI